MHYFDGDCHADCVLLTYNSRWKCHKPVAKQLLSGQMVRSGMASRFAVRGAGGPSQYKSHLPGHSPPAKLSKRRLDNASSSVAGAGGLLHGGEGGGGGYGRAKEIVSSKFDSEVGGGGGGADRWPAMLFL
jgi:hypothetical protein